MHHHKTYQLFNTQRSHVYYLEFVSSALGCEFCCKAACQWWTIVLFNGKLSVPKQSVLPAQLPNDLCISSPSSPIYMVPDSGADHKKVRSYPLLSLLLFHRPQNSNDTFIHSSRTSDESRAHDDCTSQERAASVLVCSLALDLQD